MYTAFSRD